MKMKRNLAAASAALVLLLTGLALRVEGSAAQRADSLDGAPTGPPAEVRSPGTTPLDLESAQPQGLSGDPEAPASPARDASKVGRRAAAPGQGAGSAPGDLAPAPGPVSTGGHVANASGSDVPPAVMRDRLVGFLADMEATVAPYRTASTKGADREPTFAQALAAAESLTDEQVGVLYEGLGPLITAWSVAQATSTAAVPNRFAPAAYSASETQDLEDLRQRIVAYYDRLSGVAPVAAHVDSHLAEQLDTLRTTAENLSLADLDRVQQDMSEIPTWQTILDTNPADLLPAAGSSALASISPAGAAVPLTDIHPQCADYAFGPVVVQVLDYIANIGEDLADIWSNDFFVAIAGIGQNTPNIPKIVTMAIYYPLRIVAMAAALDQALVENCNEWYHQELLATHDEHLIAMTNLISGTLTSHDLDINARFDRTDAFEAALRADAIRLALEKDLLRKGDKRISLFQIPDSLCITTGEHEVCGMLDEAHDRVADTIRIARELGLDTTAAQISFEDGEIQQGLGNYKEAYTRYREAYVLAVRAS